MPLYQVVVLAIVQGLTEFLPVSSTAHLYLSSWLLGWQTESLDFDIMLHLGTLVAVLLFFFQDWVQIIAMGFGLDFGHDPELRHNRMLLWLLAIGSIPIGVCGLAFNKMAETVWRTPVVMGIMLIAVALVMWFAEQAVDDPDRFTLDRAGAGAGDRTRMFAERDHDLGRTAAQSHARIGRTVLVPAVHAGYRGGGGEGDVGHP
jgi:undecaprenyl pyrophosphate phosphatase UppP